VVSEYFGDDSADLSELLFRWRGCALSEVHVLYLFSEILIALLRLHSHNPPLAHRNLSAETIVVTSIRGADRSRRKRV
jgi:serine/threonine protein kinase